MKRTYLNVCIVFAGLALAWSATAIHAQQSQPPSADQVQPAGPQGQPSADQAPDGQPGQPSQADPQLKISPLKALQNLEPDANAEYQIGAGDEISLDFPTRPELSGKKKVGPDGRITLNMAGSIDVANKTRSQAAQAIVAALSPYYTDLTLTVDVDSYGSNRIIVLGNVQHPGVLYFDDTPTLLDVIARGGLMANTASPGASGSNGITARDGIPERCAIYRGNDTVVWVDLRSMLQSGNALADMRLKRNDIVFIPAQQEIFVSVLGAVQHPGAVPLTPQSTLVSVLAESGGMAEGASLNHIQIAQASTGKTITVSYKNLVSLKTGNEVQLHAGDVIFVPQSGLYKSTYVLQRLSPIATMGSIAAIAAVE